MNEIFTLAEYRALVQRLAEQGAGDPRQAAFTMVASMHNHETADQVDRRWYREVYLAD